MQIHLNTEHTYLPLILLGLIIPMQSKSLGNIYVWKPKTRKALRMLVLPQGKQSLCFVYFIHTEA